MSAVVSAVHHFQVVCHNKEGWFVLGSSALTGNIWDGKLHVFSDYEDYLQCPNLTMIACNTPSGINDALWMPGDMSVVAGADNGCLELYQLQQKVLCNTEDRVQAHDDIIVGVALLAGGGEKVVSVGLDSKVAVSSITQKRVLNVYRGHSDAVVAVAVHPTSEFIFTTSSKDGFIRLWDTRKPRPASTLENHVGSVCTALAWSPSDVNTIAAGGQNGSVCITDWRKESGTNNSCHKLSPHTRDVTKLAFAPWNSKVIASTSEDTTVKVFSVNTQSSIYTSSQHTDYVYGVSWHPTRPALLSCGWDGQLILHNVTTDKSTAEAPVAPVAMETSEMKCENSKESEQ